MAFELLLGFLGAIGQTLGELILLPWAWWHRHNQNSRLGISRVEQEAETFWAKFAAITMTLSFAAWALYEWHHH